MNVSRLCSLFAVLVIAISESSSAQTADLSSGSEAYAPTRHTVTAVAPASTPYRFHKKLPQLFSGFAIEIATSTYPLDREDPIFRQFGNVNYEKLSEGGYSYLILGKFTSKSSALHFVETIIKPKAEKARLFEYKDGIRKVIRD